MPGSVPDFSAWRGLLAVFGFAAIVTAACRGAGLFAACPSGRAALIVAAVLLLAAGVAGLISKQQVQRASPAPEQTVDKPEEGYRGSEGSPP